MTKKVQKFWFREKSLSTLLFRTVKKIYDFLETNVHILFCWRSEKLSTVYDTCYA